MPQKIGLVAELDLTKFNQSVTKYITGVGDMQTATSNAARAISSSFSAITTNLQFNSNASSFSGSITRLTNNLNKVDGPLNTFHRTIQLVTRDVDRAAVSVNTLASAFSYLRSQTSRAAGGLGIVNQLHAVTQAANQAAAALARVSAASARGGGINAFSGIGGAFGGIGAGIGSAFSGILGGLAGVGSAVSSIIGNITRPLAAVVGVIGGVTKAFTSLAGGIIGSVSSILGVVGALGSTIVKVFGSIVGAVTGVIRSFFSLASTLVSTVGSVIRTVGSLASTVIRGFTSMVSGVLRIVGSLATTIGIAFNTILRTVLNIVGNLVQSVISLFSSLLRGVMSAVGNVVSGVIHAFSSLMSGVGRVLSGVVSTVTNIFSGILRSVTRIVGDLVSSVLGMFAGLARSLLGVVEGMAKSVLGVISSLARKTVDTLKSMASGILDAYKDLGNQIVRIVTVITATVTGALALAGNSVKNWLEEGIAGAAEFEQNMADIAAVLRKTREEVEPLSDLITNLGLDPRLVVSTEEAGAVVEQLARNGLEMAQILDGAANSAILLANAVGGGTNSFAEAADIATMSMQMFGLQATDINRIADVSAGVINNSRIELEDWSLALGNGGAAAAAFNVSYEDFATAIAGTVNLYHSARQAGTGLMNFYQRLVPTTQAAGEAFRNVGLYTGLTTEEFQGINDEIAKTQETIDSLDPRLYSYDQLLKAHTDHIAELKKQLVAGTSALFDQKGDFLGSKNAAIQLAKALGTLSDTELRQFAAVTVGNDAYETLLGFIQLGQKEIKGLEGGWTDLQKSITGFSSMESATTRTATLAARWKNLGDIWSTIQRQAGAGFNDMLLKLVNRMTELTSANQDRVISFFGKMADVASKLVDKLMPFVEGFLPKLLDNLEAFGYYILAIVEDGDAMNDWLTHMSPPLRNFIKWTLSIVDSLKKFGSYVLNTVGVLRKTFTPFFDFIRQNVELKDVLVAAAGAILFNIVPGMLRLVSVGLLAVKAVATIRKAWETDWGGIRSFFEQAWPKIRGPLVDFLNNFLTGKWKDAWGDAVDVVTTMLSDIEKAVPPFFKTFINLFSDILHGDWAGAWENIVKISQDSFDLIVKFLGDMETPFTDFLVHVLKGAWKKVWEDIVNGTKVAMGRVVGILRGFNSPWTDFLADVIEGKWGNVWARVQETARKSFENIKVWVRGLNTPFTDFIADILDGKWYSAWRRARGAVRDAFDGVINYLDDLNNPFTEFIADIVRGRWFEAWEDFKEIFQETKEGILFVLDELNLPFTNFIAKIIRGDWAGAWQNISNVVSTSFELIKKILSDFNQPWSDFLLDVLEGRWSEVWTTIQQTAISLLEGLRNYIPGWGQNFVSLIEEIITGDWGGAWTTAKEIASDTFDAIVAWLEDRGPWGKFAADIITGDWASAWGTAKAVIFGDNGVFSEVIKWLEDHGPWGRFAADILQGDWKNAWEEAKGILFGDNGIFTTVEKWLENHGPWGKFASDILKGDWQAAWIDAKDLMFGPEGIFTKVDTWLQSRGLWGQFISDIFHGDWSKAWTDFKELIGLTDEKIKAMKDTIYLAIGAFALATATVVSFNLRGILGLVSGIASLGLAFTQFIPLIAAVGVGIAVLRVAWEEDFMGIQSFTATIFKGIGTIVSSGVLMIGDAVDAFMAFMKEDWATGWDAVHRIEARAWQLMAQAGMLGLNLLEWAVTDGPGKTVIGWLGDTFPTTIGTSQEAFGLFGRSFSDVTNGLATDTNTIAELMGSLDTIFSTIIGTFTVFGAVVSGVVRSIGVLGEAVANMTDWGSVLSDVMAGNFDKAAATKANIMTPDAQGLTFMDKLENIWTGNQDSVDQVIGRTVDAIKQSWIDNWRSDDQNMAKPIGSSLVKSAQEVIAGAKTDLQKAIDANQLTIDAYKNRYDSQAAVISQLFGLNSPSTPGTMAGPNAGFLNGMGIEWVSTITALKNQIQANLNNFLTPTLPTASDPNHPVSVYQSIFNTIKGLGIDLTGDFLNKGKESVDNLGAGASAEKNTVLAIFQTIMSEITGTAASMIESFKTTGTNIGTTLSTAVSNSLDIHSPSKVFEAIGSFSAQGFKNGWEREIGNLAELAVSLRKFASDAQKAGADIDLQHALRNAANVSFQAASNLNGFGKAMATNYSYQTTNAPIQLGPIYINTPLDLAEFEYRVERIVNRIRLT